MLLCEIEGLSLRTRVSPQAPHVCLVAVRLPVMYLGGHVQQGADLCARHVTRSIQDLQNVFRGRQITGEQTHNKCTSDTLHTLNRMLSYHHEVSQSAIAFVSEPATLKTLLVLYEAPHVQKTRRQNGFRVVMIVSCSYLSNSEIPDLDLPRPC